ncbi:GNAT family N-acetyltransferase [Cytobacillus kochii]|uniref:GNAT family N-acetyltransferase n=1 Tax=Cytobacillus kochii TaxID=859143 RepID=UPI001CD302D8|nr:GNAT family N-acetyltransferase [Cytobacillus kochii]MCA1028798.1 GNAT family N-acetyltransferase [Cytobacillus kochii]MCM3322936.1 GNAT family N-acetyltransferase [Cytobacillus kochii]MCM3345332.1 GNAT family N-acetyltransferase [Cytobacillus kochii]MDM5208929.1 GNAT family N-acetyltransferase [Cytobacillus kochii]
MSDIHLTAITKENWYEVASLHVTTEQSKFVESNAISIIQQQYEPSLQTYAITVNQQIIGFVMYNRQLEELNGYWIYRIMICDSHQQKGYAKQALKLIMTEMKQLARKPLIIAGIHRENHASIALFKAVGFIDSGHHFGKETAYILPINEY